MSRQKETFTVEQDGKNVEYAVLEPTAQQRREAQKVYNQTFSDALKSGAFLRKAIDKYMIEQGIWTEEQSKKYEEITNNLLENEKTLKGGNIKLSEAKNIALDMRRLRFELQSLVAERDSMDDKTAEGQAENTRFNFLVSSSLVNNDTGQPIYKDLEDYENNATDQVAYLGAQKLARMMYGLNEDYESNLPENKFLKKYKFVDENLRLVDKQGRLVDVNGRLIDEAGRYIDEEGNFVDVDGNRIDENGEYIIEEKPFLDDDGNPIILEENEEDKEKEEEKEKEGGEESKLADTSEVSD